MATTKRPAYGMDFTKVDAAFQASADTAEGQKLLKGLAKVIDAFAVGPGNGLNKYELRYVLSGLIEQYQQEPIAALGHRKVANFNIWTAVDQPTKL